jgi:hypothetical protein
VAGESVLCLRRVGGLVLIHIVLSVLSLVNATLPPDFGHVVEALYVCVCVCVMRYEYKCEECVW